jgi:hypothetical protein
MPKIKTDDLEKYQDAHEKKEKVRRRKEHHFEEFDRGHRKLNKRTKKKQVRT